MDEDKQTIFYLDYKRICQDRVFYGAEIFVARVVKGVLGQICILVCNFITSKHYWSRCRSRWENLDRGQYPFQPIKFVNLVVPSHCETEPYNRDRDALLFVQLFFTVNNLLLLKAT